VCAPVAPIACLVLGLGAAACGQLPPQASTTQSPIFGGMPDTSHDAVMALVDQLSATTATACSGTTISVVGASGIFLTAGHCVVANDGMGHVTTPIKVAAPQNLFVVPGPDWQSSVHNGLYYGVAQVAVHPQYDGSVNSPFDVAVVRFLGALPNTPVIPALDPTSDKLAVGTTIDVVGFGKTETNAMNSTRFEVNRVISSITANQFLYDQTDSKGACQGDSGGPALVDTSAGTRVAGVTSFGDPDCTKVGASVRVSPVFASFVEAFVNAAPRTLSCGDCALASVGPGNACVSQSVACATTNTACGMFLTCADACTSSTCVTNCRRANSSGAAAFDAVVACQCGGMCQAVCANAQQCGGTGTGTTGGGGTGPTTGVAGSSGALCADLSDPRADCNACIQGSCCAQAAACANDNTCTGCFIQASSGACRLNTAFTALTECLAGCPGKPCSSSAGTAGASGTTGTVGGPGGGGTTGQTGGKGGCDLASSPTSGAGIVALLALAFAVSRARPRARVSARARRR
jgi:V8-like Glu-specific endopeptidase